MFVQVDAPVNSGGWGGPLVDDEGRCIGMAFQKVWGEVEEYWRVLRVLRALEGTGGH